MGKPDLQEKSVFFVRKKVSPRTNGYSAIGDVFHYYLRDRKTDDGILCFRFVGRGISCSDSRTEILEKLKSTQPSLM